MSKMLQAIKEKPYIFWRFYFTFAAVIVLSLLLKVIL